MHDEDLWVLGVHCYPIFPASFRFHCFGVWLGGANLRNALPLICPVSFTDSGYLFRPGYNVVEDKFSERAYVEFCAEPPSVPPSARGWR